jgi:hypothetical protein
VDEPVGVVVPFVPFDSTGIGPEGMRQVVRRWRRFGILRATLDNGTPVGSILRGHDPTISRLATFVALRLFPGRGTVDLLEDLIWRLDKPTQQELVQMLFPDLAVGFKSDKSL